MARFSTYGAAAGIPLALLINRYLFGNKSLKSAIWSSIFGAGAGATAGFGLEKYLEGKQHVDNQQGIQDYISQVDSNNAEVDSILSDDNTDFTDPQVVARLDKALAPFGGLKANAKKVALNIAYNKANAAMRSGKFDPSVHGMDMPLIDIPAEEMEKLNKFSDMFRSKNRSDIYREIAYGGFRPEEYGRPADEGNVKNEFNAIVDSMRNQLDSKAPQRTVAAMMVYHNKLKDIYSSSFYNNDKQFAAKNRTPEVLDYLAVHSMPEELREFLPVTYRMESIARARASNGWAYSIDRQMLQDLDYRHAAPALVTMQDDALNAANTAAVLATYNNPFANALVAGSWGLATEGIRGVNASDLPQWNPAFDSRVGDNWDVRNNRHKAVRLLSGDQEAAEKSKLQWVPLYSWMLPEANRRHRRKAISGLVSEAANTVVDLYQMKNAIADRGTLSKPLHWLKRLRNIGLEGFGLSMDGLNMGQNLNDLKYGINIPTGLFSSESVNKGNLSRVNSSVSRDWINKSLPGGTDTTDKFSDQLGRSIYTHIARKHYKDLQNSWGF